jgi:hypothetical protein
MLAKAGEYSTIEVDNILGHLEAGMRTCEILGR